MAANPKKRPKKQTRRSEEGLKSKKESDRRRAQTRITIGEAFPRWRALKEEKGLRADTDVALLLLDSYDKLCSILMTSTGTCTQEQTSLSRLGCVSASESFEEMEVTINTDESSSVKNRLSDFDSDMENVVGTNELSAPGADDSCDEDVYIPVIPQRSKTSELKLECEEEELETWQKHTLHVHLKEEDDVGELSDDQTDCKPDPSSLQSWSAGQYTLTPEASGVVHTPEVHPISNNPVSLSSVQSPEVFATSSNKLQSDQSNSQTVSVPLSLQSFTVLKLEQPDHQTNNK